MGKGYSKKWYQRKPDGYLGALLRMFPVALAAGLVPLVIREYKFDTGLESYPWFDGAKVKYDFFLASKGAVLMMLALIMLVCVSVRLWKEKGKLPFAKIFFPLFGYGLLVFLSGCFSVNRTFSFSGGYEHFESVWVLLSYVLIVYYTFLYANGEAELQVVADAVCFSATIIGIIGSLQGVGLDIFKTEWFQKLITTDTFLNMIGGELAINFTDNNAFATLYNPNYLGVYGSFMIPFLTIMLLFEKNIWRRLWHGCNFILVTIALLSSRSRAGLIAVVIVLCVAIVFAIWKVSKWWYLVVPGINFAIVLLLLVNAYNDNIIFDRLQGIWAEDQVEITEEIAEDGTLIRGTGLTELYTTAEGVAFRYNEVWTQISFRGKVNKNGLSAVDMNGEPMEVVKKENRNEYRFAHPALSEVVVSTYRKNNQPAMILEADGEWNFVYNEETESYQYITYFGELSDMIMADAVGFEKHQSMFSSRGYIWSRSIPLLKEHIFLGSGPDTFVFEFPQEDYLNMKKQGFEGQVMTKPHSWYLQVGVQTGVLSLLCLLVFFGWYAVWSVRLYAFRKLKNQKEAFGMAAFIASFGYMISGISNDSMVVTAPVFWTIIGLGVTANALVSKERKTEKKEAEPVTE